MDARSLASASPRLRPLGPSGGGYAYPAIRFATRPFTPRPATHRRRSSRGWSRTTRKFSPTALGHPLLGPVGVVVPELPRLPRLRQKKREPTLLAPAASIAAETDSRVSRPSEAIGL